MALWDLAWQQSAPPVNPEAPVLIDADVVARAFGLLEILESVVAIMAGKEESSAFSTFNEADSAERKRKRPMASIGGHSTNSPRDRSVAPSSTTRNRTSRRTAPGHHILDDSALSFTTIFLLGASARVLVSICAAHDKRRASLAVSQLDSKRL